MRCVAKDSVSTIDRSQYDYDDYVLKTGNFRVCEEAAVARKTSKTSGSSSAGDGKEPAELLLELNVVKLCEHGFDSLSMRAHEPGRDIWPRFPNSDGALERLRTAEVVNSTVKYSVNSSFLQVRA